MRDYHLYTCHIRVAHDLPNYLRFRILKNSEISIKCVNVIVWWTGAPSSCQNINFVNGSKKLLKAIIKPFL